MNKVLLLGRLTKEPVVRYSGETAVARYSLAVNRYGNKEQKTDFIDCVAFGKAGELAERYFKKGQQMVVVGRIQVRDWVDQEGCRRRSTEVVVEEQHFTGKKEPETGTREEEP